MTSYSVSLKQKDQLGKLFLLFSMGFAFYITRTILNGQFIQAGDSFWHYSNELHLIKSIENGKGIFSCLYKGMGLPLASFYQPLLYIIVAGVYFLCAKLLPVVFIHNLIICLLFSLFPLSVFYLARSFRFSTFVSGLASLFSLVPVSGWGHTVDAYFRIGLHTQLLGALLLPVVLGSIHRLRFSNHIYRNIIIAVCSSAGLVMGHAVYAVLTVYAILFYLALFLLWHGFHRFFNLLKPILLIAVCTGIIVSFWLIPFLRFNSEYKFIPESERSFSPLAVSLTVKDTLDAFLSGTLLDTVTFKSPLFGGGEEGFRWSINDSFHRFKLFTGLTIFGFLISLLTKKSFRHFFISFLMISGMFLFCGKDDFPILHILPFARNFQPIRAIFLVELSAMLLSATAVDRIFCFFNRKKFFIPLKIILSAMCVLLIIPLLSERFFIADLAVMSSVTPEQQELKSLYSKIETDHGKIYLGKYTGVKNISLRSLADCFYLNNAVGHDNDMAGSLSWLINDIQKYIPVSADLCNLLGIKYLVKRKNWNFYEEQKEITAKNFESHYSSDNYEILFNKNFSGFCSFIDSKPVLVWCDNTTWYYLNRLWINLFLKHDGKISPLVKAPESFSYLLDKKIFSAAVLINFPSSDANKTIYYNKLNEFSSKGLKIFSNKPLWDIPVDKLIPSRTEIFTDFLLNRYLYNSDASLKITESSFNTHKLKTDSNKDRLLIAKTAYYDNWKTIIDGKKQDTLWVSPGLTGCIAPAGIHDVTFEYIPSRINTLLLIFGILSMVSLYLFIKKLNINFINAPLIIIFHYHILKHLRFFSRIIVIIMIAVLAVSYVKTKTFKPVTLIYPYNNTKGVNPYEVIFRWNKIESGENYHFQIAEEKNMFSNPVFQVDNITDTSVGYRGLKQYKTYFWRVKTDKGSWSDIYRFKTGNFFPVAIPD